MKSKIFDWIMIIPALPKFEGVKEQYFGNEYIKLKGKNRSMTEIALDFVTQSKNATSQLVSPETPSSQWHTLPNREYIHSNSEGIILNNDQHQHQKIISTNNRIN